MGLQQNESHEEPKKKEGAKDELVFQMLKNMVEGANAVKLTNKLTPDGELETSQELKKTLEKVISQIGTDCLEYKNIVHDTRTLIRLSVLAGAGMIGGIALLFSQSIPAAAAFEVIGAASAVKLFEENKGSGEKVPALYEKLIPSFRRARELNRKIKRDLLALRLPQKFIDDNFDDIVIAMVMNKREEMEREELVQMRKDMGLETTPDEDKQTLEQLLEGQTSQTT